MWILLADRCSVSQQLGTLHTHSFSFLTQRMYSCSIIKEMPGSVVSGTHCIMEMLLGSHIPKWNLHSSFVGCPSLSPPNRSIELGSLQAAWLCRAPGPGLALMLVHILPTVSDSPEHVHMKIMLSSVSLLVPSLRHLFLCIYIYSQWLIWEVDHKRRVGKDLDAHGSGAF